MSENTNKFNTNYAFAPINGGAFAIFFVYPFLQDMYYSGIGFIAFYTMKRDQYSPGKIITR